MAYTSRLIDYAAMLQFILISRDLRHNGLENLTNEMFGGILTVKTL